MNRHWGTRMSSDGSEMKQAFVPALDDFDIDIQADTEAHATSRELSFTQSKLGDLLDLMPAGLLIHQEQGIVYANREAERILETGAASLVGRHIFDFLPEEDLSDVRGCFSHCLREHQQTRALDSRLIRPAGSALFVQISMSALPWEGLPVIYVLINDVDRLKHSEMELRRLSVTDPLTNAFNRRHFITEAERELERSRRYRQPVSFLLLDIDHFKRLNDTHGHQTGDEALRRFTAACQRLLRGPDVLGRIGGEEFAILLPETDTAGAQILAERLRAAVAQTPVRDNPGADRLPVTMTVSIGVAGFDGQCSVDRLLSYADKALYAAKRHGRNRVFAWVDGEIIPSSK